MSGSSHSVVVAIGSNIGDRFYNIEIALRLLEHPQLLLETGEATVPFAHVVNTSFLYESAPMYVTEQPSFINCACLLETNIPPIVLLKLLKIIETLVGRVPSGIRNGPRALDLDLLLYDDLIIDTRPPLTRVPGIDNLEGELVVPHPKISERGFVLWPLCDMIPDRTLPASEQTFKNLLESLYSSPLGTEQRLHRVIPFPSYPISSSGLAPQPVDSILSNHPFTHVPHTHSYWNYDIIHPTDSHVTTPGAQNAKHGTKLMATLNVTPDSFSDGGDHLQSKAALEYVREAVREGAAIVDIGGHSTRPGAKSVTLEEELERVKIIELIRSQEAEQPIESVQPFSRVLISVDTFRSEVARAAITMGANCINDVYAFTGPNSYDLSSSPGDNGDLATFDLGPQAEADLAAMKAVARDLAVPVVLMHSRGDARENKGYAMYVGGVIEGIQIELGRKVRKIVEGKGGVRRWLVIVDPGLGFSKTLENNLEVLRNTGKICQQGRLSTFPIPNPLLGFPILVGPSRKSFLGAILERPLGNSPGRQTTPKERIWATASAAACVVQQGALAVRVHDVKEMADVIRLADALWR